MPQHHQLISGDEQIASRQVRVNKMGLHLTRSHAEEDAAECCDQWLMLSSDQSRADRFCSGSDAKSGSSLSSGLVAN